MNNEITEKKKVSWLDKTILDVYESISVFFKCFSKQKTPDVSPIHTKINAPRPCFIVRYDGEVRESLVAVSSGGEYRVRYSNQWIAADKDGSVSSPLVDRWYHE